MMIPNIFILLLFILIPNIKSIDYDEVILDDEYETRSRILMVDGNVWLHAGKDKNITFKTNGLGRIYVDDTDVTRLPDTAEFRAHVERLEYLNGQLQSLRGQSTSHTHALRLILVATKQIVGALKNVTIDLNNLKKWREDKTARDMRRRGLLVKMTRHIIKTNKLIAMDSCQTNKCEHGGTCIPRFGPKFVCLCPPHYTGAKCETDVDECEIYDGTTGGCQNNGTCVNQQGGFQCDCQEGFHGPLCQYQLSSCSRTFELCGPHGHCVDIDSTTSKTKYKCLCDWGFKVSNDAQNPTCVDVNECESNPCHPGIDCINLPGSFQCSGCPAGYKGEGNTCVDINECEAEISPCDSLVKCLNTIGSYQCESCPSGYTGDGKECKKQNVCDNNNCNSLAKCKPSDDNLYNAYVCYCPDGYIGDGIGEDGCTKSQNAACDNNRCVNGGTCRAIDDNNYKCECDDGYSGKYCENASPCKFNPCKNGGKCEAMDNRAVCQCTNNFFGELCEDEETVCGGHFTQRNGTRQVDIDRNNTAICDFVFDIPLSNSALKINFTLFDSFSSTDSTTNCTTTLGNLTMYDGPSENSPLFATFCGDHNSVHAPLLNEPITMTSSSAMFRFRGTRGKFEVTWETVERKCGYRTSKPNGLLLIPENKQDIVCEWFISAPAEKVIEVQIPAIQMYSKDKEECEHNELEIFDGYGSYDLHRIAQICSSTQEIQTVRSTGPFLSVSFISNMLVARDSQAHESTRGFSISYKFVEAERTCGGEIINKNHDFEFTGTIESPNYGSLYPPNMDCTWHLNASVTDNSTNSDIVIKITIDEFDIPSSYGVAGRYRLRSHRRLFPLGMYSPNIVHSSHFRNLLEPAYCIQDRLRFYESNGDITFDGCNAHRPPNTLIIESPEAVINFHSDGAIQGKGFKLKYELSCEKTVIGNGTMQSWNFPNGGSAGKCTYTIQAPRTHVVQVRFKTIGLRVLTMSQCFYDKDTNQDSENYIQLSGGRTDNLFFNQKYFCPKYPLVEDNWISVSAIRPLKVIVSSDGNENNKGVSMEYKTEDVGCGGLYSSMMGAISSPVWPERYPPHMHCVYNIFVSWTKLVKLTFDEFDLETTPSADCLYDRVEVYTTYTNETVHGELIGKFCGTLVPPTLFSPTNSMSVVFISDRSVAGRGFNAKFEAIGKTTTCDKTYTAPSGEIVFNGTNNKFDKCFFHIAVKDDRKIMLKMNNMSIPCYTSKLYLRNGPSESSSGFSSLNQHSSVCGSQNIPVLRSFGNRVLLIFKTNEITNVFFNISYETVSSGCGGRVDGLSGTISSPQYPLADRRSLRCEWIVSVALGNKVRFAVTALDDLASSDASGFCPMMAPNRLDIYDSANYDSRLLKRYCRKEVALEAITSDDNEVIVKYFQMASYQGVKLFGFLSHFTTVCTGIVLTDISGSIQTPGYPHEVQTTQYCTWTIRAPRGNKIIVKMHEFSVENLVYNPRAPPCAQNYLKIDDTDLGEADIQIGSSYNTTNSINKYCAYQKLLSIKSRHNTMKLTYASQAAFSNRFWLSWHSVGCTGDIKNPTSIIITKENIDPEVDDFECQYKIQAPVGKKIKMTIEQFNILPIDTDCVYTKEAQFQGMAIFMGTNNASGVAHKTFCKANKQVIYYSHTDQIYLYMAMQRDRLGLSNTNIFFNATIEFLDTNSTDLADACGGIVDLEVGKDSTILSPGYPEPYPVGVQCRWTVNAPDGYHIEYTLDEYYSPNQHEEKARGWSQKSNYTCQYMYSFTDGTLSFYRSDSMSETDLVEKHCEEITSPRTYEVYSAHSRLHFVGASTIYGRKSGSDVKQKNGFKLTARAKCGGVVYAESTPQMISTFHRGEDVCNITIRKKDSDDAEIYVRLEEYTQLGNNSKPSADDQINIYVDSEYKATETLTDSHITMQEYTASDEMMLNIKHASAPHSAVIVYSTDESNCGGSVRHMMGTIREPNRRLDKPFDCEWTIMNTIGNRATIQILSHNLPATPNCVDSYIEIRKFNSSGDLIRRQCDSSDIDTSEFYAQSLWVLLRYRPAEDDDNEDGDNDNDKKPSGPLFVATYQRLAGSDIDGERNLVNTSIVQMPIIDRRQDVRYSFDCMDNEQSVVMKFNKFYLRNTSSFFTISAMDSTIDSESQHTGITLGKTYFYTDPFQILARIHPGDDFELTYECVPTNTVNQTTKTEKKVYDCGGPLTPTWEWESITNPLPAGQTYGYEENLHCRWELTRPMFHGVELAFEYLDLENAENCEFDFVSFRMQLDDATEDGEIDFTNTNKLCSHRKTNYTYNFTINRVLHIHFVSDRSHHGRGFKLKFRLTCNSFEHIPNGVAFEQVITSPNYNTQIERSAFKCQWTITLESNRKLFVDIIDLDMEDGSPCALDNRLLIGSSLISMYGNLLRNGHSSNDMATYCGTLGGERANYTTYGGRLFMKLFSTSKTRKGFKLIVREQTTECPSGILHLDESTPNRTLYSPEYPEGIPNSAECEYVLAAPNGRRIMLTFDPDNFDMANAQLIDNATFCEDFIEVRDGPTKLSALIGKYCGNRPPSTIYSTSNHMYMRLRTNEYVQSNRFVAHYQISTCGGTIMVHENQTSHVTSPGFPDPFNSPLECKWDVRSPNTHLLMTKVEHLWVMYNLNCTLEYLEVLDGNDTAPALIPKFCNPRVVSDKWVRSESNQMTVKFVSNTTAIRASRNYCAGKKCGFDLSVKLSDIKCGGKLSDNQGRLTAPGFPGRLLPHVKCKWEFKAKPGFVYQFRFNFTEEEAYRDIVLSSEEESDCFEGVQVTEGVRIQNSIFYTHRFCKNTKIYTSVTDVVQVYYNDILTRDIITRYQPSSGNMTFYAPFTVDYRMIPADPYQDGCTFAVSTNKTMEFQTGTKDYPRYINMKTKCHLEVSKPTGYNTVWMKADYKNVGDNKEIASCYIWDSYVQLKSNSPIPLDVSLCEARRMNNETDIILNNELVDVYLSQGFKGKDTMQFSFSVEFQECGGIITEPNSGTITSPNYSDDGSTRYLPNSRCRWVLNAPEGQVVQIEFTEMQIEYDHDCKHDRLIIGEGKQSELNKMHTYCNRDGGDDVAKLEDRFKKIRSKGQSLTLIWITDRSGELKGWKLDYEFVNEADTCGYHTTGMSGMIHSPNFGKSDYDNDMECVWDIQVPLGYHVDVTFESFDIETSDNCEKDKLEISQEHSSRALSPSNAYYFIFHNEEKNEPLCGITKPPMYSSESNRIRLNFTSDEKTTARGFKANWEAKCGSIYRLTHGVITSPHYPDGYPNTDNECGYFISPENNTNPLIAIKFNVFELSPIKTNFDRKPCEDDHIQIVDVVNSRLLYSLCADDPIPTDAMVFNGRIAIKFITTKSYIFSPMTKRMKPYKGFEITYSIEECGGVIDLNEDTGLIKTVESPAFPLPQQHNLDCYWNVTTSSDRRIVARFKILDMENYADCSADYLELFDSSNPQANKSIGKFCGGRDKIPTYNLKSTGSSMLIHMKTDFSTNSGGFRLAVFGTLNEKAGCGGQLEATKELKTLTNPKDENGNYPGSMLCGWTISGPQDTQLQITITQVDTEPLNYPPGDRFTPECIDSLAIYDGQERFSPPLIQDLCTSGRVERNYPIVFTTSHRHAYVLFETDKDGTGKGFNITYTIRDMECGGWLKAESTTKSLIFKGMTKEENKETERTHQRCRYIVQGTKTEPVIIHFSQFKLPSKAQDCSDSYIEIRDVGSLSECQHPACTREPNQRKVTRWCGSSPIPPHISNTNTIQIIVAAEIQSQNKSIIQFDYQLLDNCNRTIDVNTYLSGRLTSPNYPNHYGENSSCTTDIITHNKKVMMVFAAFNFEGRNDNNECGFDYLNIKTDDTNGTRYCESVIPETILSNGKDIKTELRSDYSDHRDGYDSTYLTVVSETDDTIQFADVYDANGVISSIGYPNGYNQSMKQIFTLRPPFSHLCSFTLIDLNIGLEQNEQKCKEQDEYVDIEVKYKGEKRQVRVRQCTLPESAIRTIPKLELRGDSEDRYLKFTFKSDDKNTNDGRGFKVQWTCNNFDDPGTNI